MNTELNPYQLSNRKRDRSFTDSAEGTTPESAASEAFALSSPKKCKTTKVYTTLSPTSPFESSLTSTSQESHKAFSTQLQMIPIASSNFSRHVDPTATQSEYPDLETAIGIIHPLQGCL